MCFYVQITTGGPGQWAHLAPTYAAINALCIIGTEEAYNSIDRWEILFGWNMICSVFESISSITSEIIFNGCYKERTAIVLDEHAKPRGCLQNARRWRAWHPVSFLSNSFIRSRSAHEPEVRSHNVKIVYRQIFKLTRFEPTDIF